MKCPTLSFYAFVVLCALLGLMVICVTWGSKPYSERFFREWRDVRDAFRGASKGERYLVAVSVVAQLLRTGGWGTIAVTAGAGFPVVGAICSDIPGIIRAISDALKGIFESCLDRSRL